MADFTSSELKMIHQGLILLKDKGPGWPVISADAFARFRADLHCLQIKVDNKFRDASYQEEKGNRVKAAFDNALTRISEAADIEVAKLNNLALRE